MTTITKKDRQILRFSSIENPDQNGFPSIITYFEYTIDGEQFQISFHTPLNLAYGQLLDCAKSKKGRLTSWNHKLNGSRDGVFKTAHLIGMC